MMGLIYNMYYILGFKKQKLSKCINNFNDVTISAHMKTDAFWGSLVNQKFQSCAGNVKQDLLHQTYIYVQHFYSFIQQRMTKKRHKLYMHVQPLQF